MKLDRWLELEDTMLTNQPAIFVRGKRVPDPRIEPTELYLFCYEARRLKRGIYRRTFIQTLKGSTASELRSSLEEFVARKDVVLIGDQKRPDYLSYHGEPVKFRRELQEARA
jgi:hypothetical protein